MPFSGCTHWYTDLYSDPRRARDTAPFAHPFRSPRTSSPWASSPPGESRTHTARVLRQLHERRRPVVITQNGRPTAVLVSPEDFDDLTEERRLVAAVSDGLADVEAGRVVADEELELGASDRASRHGR